MVAGRQLCHIQNVDVPLLQSSTRADKDTRTRFLLELGDCQLSCSGKKAPHIWKRQQKLQPAFHAQFQPFKIYFTDPQSPAARQCRAKWSGAADVDGNRRLS